MSQMSNQELLALLNQAEQDAVAYNGEYMKDNENFLKRYLAEAYGDEVDGQSQVISTDVADVVDSDMSSLVRVFLGSGEILTFDPLTDADEQEAIDKTSYVDWIVRGQRNSYKIIHDWMKDAEIQKTGVVKYFVEECEKTEEHEFTGITEQELGIIQESLDGESVSKIDITERTEADELGAFDVVFRVKKTDKSIKVINIPTESFLISRHASCKDDAAMVGDRVVKTRGELLSEGFDRDLIDRLPSIDDDLDRNTTLKSIRHKDDGGSLDSEIRNWASEEVEISDLYVDIDFDGDGIAESRHILKSGNHVLVNEAFDHKPYAMLSCIMMPHRAIGRSRAEITMQTQRIKTAITRQMNDNIYAVNHPRTIVDENTVVLDDFLTQRVNGMVRNDGPVMGAAAQLEVPYIGDKALQQLQYQDQARAQSTGTMMASQGLDADSINKETATRFKGVEEAAQAKIELVARNFAETGFRDLYEGVAWLASRYQDSEKEIRVLGRQMTVNPADWRYDQVALSNVGLGAGDNERLVESLSAIMADQQGLMASGSPLVDTKKMHNVRSRIVKGLGMAKPSEFYNDPERPEQLVQAENEILRKSVEQMQLQIQQLQNPLAEAETIKAQAKLIEAQGSAGIEAAKITENARQFDDKLESDNAKALRDLALKLTELEAKFNTDLSRQNNENMVRQL